MKGMQNTSLSIAALQAMPKIFIYSNVNSDFGHVLRLALPSLGCFT
jgi:hypothetical protein